MQIYVNADGDTIKEVLASSKELVRTNLTKGTSELIARPLWLSGVLN